MLFFSFRSRVALVLLVALSIAASSQTANAKVTNLLRDDGDLGDPLPARVYIGLPEDNLIAPAYQEDVINNIHWTASVADPTSGCSKEVDLGFNKIGVWIRLRSLGTVTIRAAVTYEMNSGGFTPTPNTVSHTLTVYPPDGFKLVPFDQPAEFSFIATPENPINAGYLCFQLTVGENEVSGYNLTLEEKIAYLDPAGTVEWKGGWSGPLGWATLLPSGIAFDTKTRTSDRWPGVGLGGQLYKYKQTVGVSYADWCGARQVVELGSITFTARRSMVNANKWVMSATKP